MSVLLDGGCAVAVRVVAAGSTGRSTAARPVARGRTRRTGHATSGFDLAGAKVPREERRVPGRRSLPSRRIGSGATLPGRPAEMAIGARIGFPADRGLALPFP